VPACNRKTSDAARESFSFPGRQGARSTDWLPPLGKTVAFDDAATACFAEPSFAASGVGPTLLRRSGSRPVASVYAPPGRRWSDRGAGRSSSDPRRRPASAKDAHLGTGGATDGARLARRWRERIARDLLVTRALRATIRLLGRALVAHLSEAALLLRIFTDELLAEARTLRAKREDSFARLRPLLATRALA
jgi:hypothetical protein